MLLIPLIIAFISMTNNLYLRYTLSCKEDAIAVMLCAFFPKFPTHSNDNRYHLQAFRHLYVLAAERRTVLPRDVDTGFPSYVPMEIKFKVSRFQYLQLDKSYVLH